MKSEPQINNLEQCIILTELYQKHQLTEFLGLGSRGPIDGQDDGREEGGARGDDEVNLSAPA